MERFNMIDKNVKNDSNIYKGILDQYEELLIKSLNEK
jgi:hypothetical protein